MKQRLNGLRKERYKWINVQFVTIELICANADMVVVVILTEASVEQWSWITYICSLKNKLRTSQTFKGNAKFLIISGVKPPPSAIRKNILHGFAGVTNTYGRAGHARTYTLGETV